jgi:hypothetical protein
MAINDTLLRDLLDFSDEQGVLSFYVGHTPAQAADPQPTAPIELRNQIKDLKARLTDEDADTAKAVTKRLEAINGELNALLDPKAHGQGRALFVGVADGRTASVSLQIPFRQRVVFHDGPFVRPLVSALDEGRSAGILIVSRSAVRLLRWAVGEVEELDSEEFTVGDAQLADIKSGPSHGTPANPNQGLVNKERFEDRIDENRNRFLRSVADDVAAQAKEHGWDRVVLSGPAKLREFVGELLEHAATNGLRVVHAEADWEHDSPATIAQHVWPVLRSVHERREQDLVDPWSSVPAPRAPRPSGCARCATRSTRAVSPTSSSTTGSPSRGSARPRTPCTRRPPDRWHSPTGSSCTASRCSSSG